MTVNIQAIVKDSSGEFSERKLTYSAARIKGCCGILEIQDVYFYNWKEGPFRRFSREQRETATSESTWKRNITSKIVLSARNHSMVVLTDKVGGWVEQMLSNFEHPGWSKTFVYSETPNPNTDQMLVTCVLNRKKASGKKSKK